MTDLALGFGCASILGRVGRRQSLMALNAAWDAGIRHLDIARSYGWGEAEGLLGEFLRHKPRGEYTLVTKCGIVPTKPSRLKSAAKGMARQLLKRVPASRSLVRAAARSSFQPIRSVEPAVLCASLDQSLAALRTDHVDTLLLHNFAPDIGNLPEIVEFFRRAQAAGKARHYGFAVEGNLAAGLERLSREVGDDAFVVQAAVSEAVFLQAASIPSTSVLQLHAPFRFLSERGLSPADAPALFAVLARRTPCKVVVCSMTSRAHVAANVAAVSASSTVSEDTVAAFLERATSGRRAL
jgi:aryl-alcohol dehydrogenase-like predicted oxidoreductase